MPKQNLEACRLNAINNAEDDSKIIVGFPLQHENWNELKCVNEARIFTFLTATETATFALFYMDLNRKILYSLRN